MAKSAQGIVAWARVFRGVMRATTMLRLCLLDERGEARRSLPYKLSVGGETIEGETDNEGILMHRVPVDAEKATLEIEGQQIEVEIRRLDPIEEVSGVQQRLRNLGYAPGRIDGMLGPKTREAIRAFQLDNPPLVADGVCGPETRAKLLEKHGC
jgi:hypothetical protein